VIGLRTLDAVTDLIHQIANNSGRTASSLAVLLVTKAALVQDFRGKREIDGC
jgi:hypothetical protein